MRLNKKAEQFDALRNWLNHSKSFFFNRYFLLTLFFLVWMFFFDANSVMVHLRLSNEIYDLRKEKSYYQQEYEKLLKEYFILKHNSSERERYARENYFMKKKNEDIFIITYEDEIPKQP